MDDLRYNSFNEFLNAIATTTDSDDVDYNYMNYLLKYIMHIPSAMVLSGMVYGVDKQPVDIHTMARTIQKALLEKGLITQNDIKGEINQPINQ